MLAVPGPYTRAENWPSELATELQASKLLSFEWGLNDCLQFVGRCIFAQSGINPLIPHFGKYTSAKEALSVLRRNEQVKLPVDLADKLWGMQKPISFARMGDIVATTECEPKGMGPSLGICYGRNSLFVGTSEEGHGLIRLETLTLEHCYQPWALL